MCICTVSDRIITHVRLGRDFFKWQKGGYADMVDNIDSQ